MKGPFLIAMGTRPEFVKLLPVIRELRRLGAATHVVLTGQHWDEAMCREFLGDVAPNEIWDLPGDTFLRLAKMTELAAAVVERVQPRAVVILGDTNTVPVFALASRRACVPVVHIEAGLRSLNPHSVEEANRRVAAALASLHFAPTETAAAFLLAEGVSRDHIRVVGNTAIDALKTMGVEPIPRVLRHGVLATAHRPTNVDGDRLTDLVASILAVHSEIGAVTFPVHPRTRARLDETGLFSDLKQAGVELCAPMGHRELLDLLRSSQLVLTDSGGLQEEAAYFGVPAVVLRRSTPRWEGIRAGVAALSALDPEQVLSVARRVLANRAHDPGIYGDGKAALRIAEVLLDPATESLLCLDEPDYTDGTLPEAILGCSL